MLQISENKAVNQMLNQVVDTINDLVHDQLSHILRLTKIGESLSSETDLDKIFDMILEEAIAFTNADAATIYKVSDDLRRLEFEIVYNRSMNMKQGGSHSPINWPAIELYTEGDRPRLTHIVTSVYHSKAPLCFTDVYETKDYDITGTIATDTKYGYRCKSMLTIPLKNHEDEVLGIIQIINAMDRQGNIVSFTEEHRTMLNSLASQAAIALSNRKLIASLEDLLMQFMRSIATGIERKSKYSSDHIMRVANLTDMIAERINSTNTGKFASFSFTENELKELSMAGWMHDVGKIITPEFIMDKSTKLETILDRIELVELRFERLALLCESLFLKLSPSDYKDFIHRNIYADIDPSNLSTHLQDDLSFIKRVNIGGEFVPDADIERIEHIAGIRFDHDGKFYHLLTEDEKNNLQIRRGTLTHAEMKQMSSHVAVTWEMLSQLSFPKKYKNVAFYAATHHEKLNGKGYPRGLTADDLPLQSRIIAVADIFEALTAADRPYKKAKTLTESLRIMAFCVKDGDLDHDLLNFFIESGLYLEFARKYMHSDQIDDVDVAAIKKIYNT